MGCLAQALDEGPGATDCNSSRGPASMWVCSVCICEVACEVEVVGLDALEDALGGGDGGVDVGVSVCQGRETSLELRGTHRATCGGNQRGRHQGRGAD